MNNTSEEILLIIRETFESLQRSGIIESGTEVNSDTVILGNTSILDSIAFITFITELEDRLSQQYSENIYIVLNEITEFNINNPYLTNKILANYLEKLLNKNG